MLETTDSSAGACGHLGRQMLANRSPEHLYLHVSALHLLPAEWRGSMEMAARIACAVPEQQFNVIKLHRSGDEISLLDYVDFFDDAFPALGRSWKVSLSRGTSVFRTYEESRNPPILHRKELLLVPDDLRRSCVSGGDRYGHRDRAI